ncbi:MAG: hypothetical protein JRI90_13065 [Deltaproteobacteria bacterium]|nr:hypothetical protein [Deltaproteobacteria bacterium]
MKAKSISIRNVPEDVYVALQAMAKKNHRSLQEQIKLILEQEVRQWRRRLQGRQLSDTVKAIREDRNR